MQRRRRILLGLMWVAALAAVALIALTLEPAAEGGRALRADALERDPSDRAPSQRRAEQPVPEDEASPALYRMGRRHTGRSPYRGPSEPRRAWTYRAGGRITAQPIVGEDGSIYVGDQARQLHALTAAGAHRWSVDTRGPVWSAALLSGDSLVVGSDGDVLLAFATADGAPRWRLATAGDADSASSVAPDGTLHFTAGPHLYALSPSGTVRWRFRARDTFLLSTPAVDGDGTTYVGSIDDHLYAVAADGRLRWTYRSGGNISSSPVIGDDGTVYFGSDDRRVHAVTRDGQRRWSKDLDGFVRAPVALGRDGDIIAAVYGPRPRVVSLDAATGALRWSFAVGSETTAEAGIASAPLVDAEGDIYFGAPDDFVYSVTREGRLRWIYPAGSDVDGDPVLTPHGTLLIGCDGGLLHAIADAASAAANDATSAPANDATSAPSN
jgi:outer membrane protein assembly factor BamB